AVYQDGAYNSFIGGAGINMFDVDRVEILRGPQGTLFGRNATGGLVQVITRKPTDKTDAYVTAEAGSYGLEHVESAIGGALGGGVNGRLALSATRSDGFVTNTLGGKKEGQKNLSLRGQVDFRLSDSADLLINLHSVRDDVVGTVGYKTKRTLFTPGIDNGLVQYARNDAEYAAFCQGFFGSTPPPGSSDCFGFQDPKPSDPWTVANDYPGYMDRTMVGATATLNWQISPGVKFTSISDYLKLRRLYSEDTDGTWIKLFNFLSDMDSYQLSQELRLSGEAGALNWQTGAYLLDIHHDIHTGADANTSGDGSSPFDYVTSNYNHQRTKSYSVFGQIDWKLAERWSATVGARFVKDRKSMQIDANCLYGGCSTFGLTAPGLVQGVGFNETVAPGQTERSDNGVAGRVELDYHPADGYMVYASVNRGIKGGGFNAAAIDAIPLSLVSYKPEVLTAYEVGFKSTFFDRRAQLNASTFYYDYHDYQAFTLTGLSPFVFNTNANTKGAEVELHFLPFATLDVTLGVAYLDAIAHGVPLQFGVGPYLDQRPPQSPNLTADLSVRKGWSFANGSQLVAQVTANHVGQRYFNTINHPVLSDNGYTMSNLRLTYKAPSGHWESALWINNVTNVQYVDTAFDMSTTNGVVAQAYGPPRIAGLSISYFSN
ncbi:MAG: TonB-dependent receptor, partial [Proteobacteria bacterium]|nr:TonB-dependent receptor [Pseudomonadota bacterium]